MQNNKVVEKLEEIINKKEQEITQLKYSNEFIQKKILLFEAIRAFDLFFLFLKKQYQDNISDYAYGFNEFLRIYYGDYAIKGGFPLAPSTKQMQILCQFYDTSLYRNRFL